MGRESGEENKRKGLSLVFVFVFLLFLGIFDYPFVSRLYNERVQGQVAVGYGNSIDTLEDETLEAEWERAQAYNRELAGSSVVLADSFQAVREGQGEYQSLLNPDGDGLMAVLEIPKIDLRLPVYHGTTEKVLQMGAGHLEGTSLPVGGESTHTCISAHRGLPDKTMFTSLDQLEEGDRFLIRVLNRRLVYEVCGMETVEPHDTEALAICPGEDRATLITCTPYGINTHRLYIHGRRLPDEEWEAEEAEGVEERQTPESFGRKYGFIGVNVLLVLWMIFLLYRFCRSREA